MSFEDRALRSKDEIVVRFLNHKGLDHKGLENVADFIDKYAHFPRPDSTLWKVGGYSDTLASLFYATPSTVDPKFSVYHAFCLNECKKRRAALKKTAFLRQNNGADFNNSLEKVDEMIERHSKLLEDFAGFKLNSEKEKLLRFSGPC